MAAAAISKGWYANAQAAASAALPSEVSTMCAGTTDSSEERALNATLCFESFGCRVVDGEVAEG